MKTTLLLETGRSLWNTCWNGLANAPIFTKSRLHELGRVVYELVLARYTVLELAPEE